ncbi:MAG: type IX secretion system membrane protein PorP/SprF [Cyclobacteriaceae bacterium]|nr:type IX secretion system membrane protein PorP/SprF [Cyclobacteriaceae bacterium]
MKYSLRIRFLLFTVVFCGSISCYSQQDPLYGLYLNNPFVINPAYAGINNNLTAFASFRNQWAGFDGAPSTISAGAHMSVMQNKLGVGLMFVGDKIGENTNNQISASFAYKLRVNDGTTLSFGMQAGYINYKIDPSQLILQDPTDPAFAAVSQAKPNVGVGAILKGDKFLLGLSVPRLVNSTVELGGQNINVYQQHYYLMGSYLFFLSESIILKPSILLKAVSGSPLSADANVNFIFNRKYSVGAYTRNLNSYGLLAQLDFLDKYRLSYAFEIPTNGSVGTRFVTNEIMLSIRTSVLRFHENSVSNF